MTFIVEYSNENTKAITELNLFTWAKIKLAKAKFGATEILLDRYCKKAYKQDLRTLCWLIIWNTKFISNNDGRLIGKIKNRQLDEIARLITYGNGRIQGSPILKKVLTW